MTERTGRYRLGGPGGVGWRARPSCRRSSRVSGSATASK